MWKASASYVMPADKLFSPLLSGHPVESLLLSVGTRVLFGLLVGFLYLASKRTRHKGLWIGVISFSGVPFTPCWSTAPCGAFSRRRATRP